MEDIRDNECGRRSDFGLFVETLEQAKPANPDIYRCNREDSNFQPSDVSFFAGFQTVLRATPFSSGVWRTCWLGKTNGDDAGRSAPACNLSDGLEVTVFPLNEDHVLFLLEIDGRYSWRKHFAGTQKCRNTRIGNSSRGVPLRGGR